MNLQIIQVLFSVAGPFLVDPTPVGGCLTRSHVVETHVRTLVVEELNGPAHGSSHLLDGMKFNVLEQLVLYRAVQSLSDRVILGISALSHADAYARLTEHGGVCGTYVLHSPVRVMDEVCPSFLLQGRHGLQKAFHAMPRLQCLAHVPSEDLLGVVVGYHGQVAEGMHVITCPNRYVRDIRHPS